MTNKADDILTKLENDVAHDVTKRITQHSSGKSPKQSHAEAKQQLADGLVAALPKKLDIHKADKAYGELRSSINHREEGFNTAIDQAEAAIRAYFGIGGNQDTGSTQDNTTPTVLGHEADNFNDRSAK